MSTAFAQDRGFTDDTDLLKHVSSVKVDTPERKARYDRWLPGAGPSGI